LDVLITNLYQTSLVFISMTGTAGDFDQ
jgi:hypothetical protein